MLSTLNLFGPEGLHMNMKATTKHEDTSPMLSLSKTQNSTKRPSMLYSISNNSRFEKSTSTIYHMRFIEYVEIRRDNCEE